MRRDPLDVVAIVRGLAADKRSCVYPREPRSGLEALAEIESEEFGACMRGQGKLVDFIGELKKCELIATGGHGFSAVQREFIVSFVRAAVPRLLGVDVFRRNKAEIERTLRQYGVTAQVHHDEDWSEVRCEQRYFVWVQANRQVGKTTAIKAGIAALLLSAPGFSIVHVAHDISFAEQNLAEVKIILAQALGGNLDPSTQKNNVRNLIMNNGSSCIVKSPDPNRLRGQSPDMYVVDEASFVKESVITRGILPVVLGNDGVSLVCMTTPNPDHALSRELLESNVGRRNGTLHHIQSACRECRSRGAEQAARCAHRLGLSVKPWNVNSRRTEALKKLAKLSLLDFLIENMGWSESAERAAFLHDHIEAVVKAPRIPHEAGANLVRPADGVVHIGIDPNSKGCDYFALVALCTDSSGNVVVLGLAVGDRSVNEDAARMRYIVKFLDALLPVLVPRSLRAVHTAIESNLGVDSTANIAKVLSAWGQKSHIPVVHEAHLPGPGDAAVMPHRPPPNATVFGVPSTGESNKGPYIDAVAQLLKPGTGGEFPLLRFAKNLAVVTSTQQMSRATRKTMANLLVAQLRDFKVKFTTARGHPSYSGKGAGARDDLVLALAIAVYYRRRSVARNRLQVTLHQTTGAAWTSKVVTLAAVAGQPRTF